MLAYTITVNESCSCEPQTVNRTITCSDDVEDFNGSARWTTNAYTTIIVSSNCNATSIYSSIRKGEYIKTSPGEPTGGGIGCNNAVNFTKIFYISNGLRTEEEKSVTNSDCDYTETVKNYNIPAISNRAILTTTNSQRFTTKSSSQIDNFGTVPIAVFVGNKLSTSQEFTQRTTQDEDYGDTTTVKSVTNVLTSWTYGYSAPGNLFSPAVTPNLVVTRIELFNGEGIWYPNVDNLSQLTTNSNIDIKEIMTFKEFPATIDLKPFILSSKGAIAEGTCNVFEQCSVKASTSSSIETKSETITSSSFQQTTYTSSITSPVFPISTRTASGFKRTTRTTQIQKIDTLVTNIDTFSQYTTSQSTFKISLEGVTWSETYLNLTTQKNTIRSSVTYTRSTTAGGFPCNTTHKVSWSQFYRLYARPNPSIFIPGEIKKMFFFGQAIPSVTNNFNLQVKAGSLTLESVSYGFYLPNVRVILPLKYTYNSSTALVNGNGIKLSVRKQSGIETSFYPFSQNGVAISKHIYINQILEFSNCEDRFFIGGFSPDGKQTNSIERVSLGGLYGNLANYSSSKEFKEDTRQEKVPIENSTAYYPINSNKFHIIFSSSTTSDLYISTNRNTDLKEFLKTMNCRKFYSSYKINIASL